MKQLGTGETRAFLEAMRAKYRQPEVIYPKPLQRITQRVVVSALKCSVRESDWSAIYEVLPNGHLRLKECIASVPAEKSLITSPEVFSREIIDYSTVEQVCPLCDAHPLTKTDGTVINSVVCGRCGMDVCLGRSEITQHGLFFRCWCGRSALVRKLSVTMTGSAFTRSESAGGVEVPRIHLRLTNGGR
jgi:hypothetical protein